MKLRLLHSANAILNGIIPLISSHRFPLCRFRQSFFSYHPWIVVHGATIRGGGGGVHGNDDGGGGEHGLLWRNLQSQ